MTLHQFKSLSDFEKAEAVWQGTLLSCRENGFFRIVLYQVNSFYVEVFYNKTANVILDFRPFSGTKLLEPYLGKINISGIF